MTNEEYIEALKVLERRVERLSTELVEAAPKIIIKNELFLIKEVVDKILSEYFK